MAVAAALPVPVFAAEAQAEKLLRITKRNIEVKGKAAKVFGLIGPDGKSGLYFTKGERFKVKLQNESGEPTLIHWHGLTPDYKQDGVPGVGQPLLPSGQSYVYDFDLPRAGTNWMHAHTLQEQSLLAAPLIIRDKELADEQEVVVLLHDFSFKTPEELQAQLKKSKPDAMPMDHEAMHMHANDIEYDAFLANDRTLDDPEVVQVEKGGKVRLRVINAATSSSFALDLGTLEGELIAVDGMPIKPVRGKTFPLAMAQRLDVRLSLPKEGGVFPVLAGLQASPQRTGILLANVGASISKIEAQAKNNHPLLDMELEERLSALNPLADKKADIEYRFALRGTMSPYEWSIVRLAPEGGEGLQPKKGQRVQVAFHNQSMMGHPMHLHGHHFQVVSINEKPVKGALRDTVYLPPHAKVVLAFDADNPGRFPFHCHHLYHMAGGMMMFVDYAG